MQEYMSVGGRRVPQTGSMTNGFIQNSRLTDNSLNNFEAINPSTNSSVNPLQPLQKSVLGPRSYLEESLTGRGKKVSLPTSPLHSGSISMRDTFKQHNPNNSIDRNSLFAHPTRGA